MGRKLPMFKASPSDQVGHDLVSDQEVSPELSLDK